MKVHKWYAATSLKFIMKTKVLKQIAKLNLEKIGFIDKDNNSTYKFNLHGIHMKIHIPWDQHNLNLTLEYSVRWERRVTETVYLYNLEDKMADIINYNS